MKTNDGARGRLLLLPALLALAGCATAGGAIQVSGGGPSAGDLKELHSIAHVPTAATLILIMSPSPLAEATAFGHAEQIVKDDAMPNLTIYGLFEQISIDDGPPFDRAFLSTQSPTAVPPGISAILQVCRGTSFQKALCDKKNEAAIKSERSKLIVWRSGIDRETKRWKSQVISTLTLLEESGRTEELSGQNNWDIRGVLLKAGQVLQASPSPQRCVALLGGLAVRYPPRTLRPDLLAGATVIVAGWGGTQHIQDAWRAALEPFGVKIIFLPQAVTDIKLSRTVKNCLVGAAS